MLEHKIRVISEGLARAMDRRAFLKRAGSAIAGGLAALTLGPALARAGVKAGSGISGSPQCVPPGPYCNIGSGILSGCRGGHCYQHVSGGFTLACKVYYAFYGTGCWTTAVSGGNWVCCDCQCTDGLGHNANCGCAQFNPGGDPSPH